jgi:hypothetical protein
MHIGTRIFNKLTAERECQVKRWNRVKRELDRLLVEYDHRQSAEQIALSPSATSKRLTPIFVTESERVDLRSGSIDRMKAIEQFADTVSTHSLNEAWQNGEHLSYLASLILSEDRSSLELKYEIQSASYEYTGTISRIQLIDRLILGLLNMEPEENQSVSEFVQQYRMALGQLPE